MIRTNISNLPLGSYILGFLNGKLAAKVQEKQPCEIPQSDRWGHCGVMWWDGEGWSVCHADFDAGVVEETWQASIKDNHGRLTIQAVPYPELEPDQIRQYVGKPFSHHKMFRLRDNDPTPILPSAENDGYTCGEIVALADGGFATQQTGRPAAYMRPVDLQLLAMHLPRPILTIEEASQ